MQRTIAALLATGALALAGCQQQPSIIGVLATGESLVTSIAVDDGFVYWTRADGTVKKLSLDTGQVSTIDQRHGTTGNLVQDDSSLYWSVDSNLLKIPKAGGPLEIHPQTAPIRALSLDEANVYWTADDGGVNKATKDGFAVQSLAMSDNPRPILAGTPSIYWGADLPETAEGALFQVPVGGGMASSLLSPGTTVSALAQDTAHIFWGGDGTINMMAYDGSNPQVLATVQTPPIGLLTDSSSIFWSNADGQVQTVSISGGDPQPFIQGPTQCPTNPLAAPVSIAMDATTIYWANYCDDTILAVPKP